jgi:hypothetical protein
MKSRRLPRSLGWLTIPFVAVAYLQANGSPTVQAPDSFSPSVTPQHALLQKYCIGCHNEKSKMGGLTLSALDLENPGSNAETWETVVRKLRARSMPPAGRPRPDEAGYDSLITHLETSLDRVAAANPNPGRTETFRRLNRTEYQNAVRDLLDVEIDIAAMLPSDDSSHGFDNISVGDLSPTLLERYLSAAQKISRLAVGTPVRSAGAETVILPSDLTQEDHFEGLPFGTRAGATVRYTFPSGGEYEFQLRLTRDRNERIEALTEPHQIEVSLDGEQLQLFGLKPPPRGQVQSDEYGADISDAHLNFRAQVDAGPHVVRVVFLKRPSALIETERQPYHASFNSDRTPRTQPALYSVSIAGPFDPTGVGDTPSRRRIFTCRPSKPSEDHSGAGRRGSAPRVREEATCAKTILSTLARRAYRRPVTSNEIQTLTRFYEEGRKSGSFEHGIEMALRALLTSPEFLFRIEREPAAGAQIGAYRIDDLELASRLSFFLWSSIPDDELLELATKKRLRDPAVLEQQVRRMLADRRAQALVNNFAAQWLYLRNLESARPDNRLFPDFDDNLRQAFRRETELFFESIVREDRSALDLLSANYTFVNQRLAKHYGIPNIYGSHFRRVELGEGHERGGLLGHGSILTVTSYANRTSPVLRGKWILENLLGTPVPPPLQNVPPLPESKPGEKILSMRERMVQHRANPACASCHQLMDPVGLATENFDAIGRFRTRSEAGTPIDASGGLPDGSTFEGAIGLRRAVLNRPELFVTTLTEKLMVYALGRGLEYYDAPAVRAITRDARPKNYRFSSIILGIVNSTPFRMRRVAS